MIIRLAKQSDLPSIVLILNQAIDSEANGITDRVSVTDRKDWFSRHDPDSHAILVAATDDNVIGWASIGAYRPGRDAFRHTAEISYYVHEDHRRCGVGTRLIQACIARCPSLQIHTLIAILLDTNHASILLLEKLGFARWGWMPATAEFHRRKVGHLYYGLHVAQ